MSNSNIMVLVIESLCRRHGDFFDPPSPSTLQKKNCSRICHFKVYLLLLL